MAKNIEYIQNRLGAVILSYQSNTGELPEEFEAALNKYNDRLPNRGDYFGRPLVYQKLDSKSFRFVAFGSNGKYNDGGNDDIIVKYNNGVWSNNSGK